nr:MAG: major capsid protein [Microviridae sp.]
MQPLVAPIMDNLYLDTYWFFVPNRLVWEHWKNFCGENTTSKWVPSVEYSVPKVEGVVVEPPDDAAKGDCWLTGDIADYMGLPIRSSSVKAPADTYLSVNALPFRGYALIWNEFFRDQNLQDPIPVPVDDLTRSVDNTDTLANRIICGSGILKACKYHDYFTSCLPAPQKGPDVDIPLSGLAKVVTGNPSSPDLSSMPLSFNRVNDRNNAGYLNGSNPSQLGLDPSSGSSGNLIPNNLYASLGSASLGTINELRLAFQMQRIYEKDARGGTRYTEILKNHFGVTSPDARLQRPEYLGGSRIPININQVVQTSSSSNTPQGNTAAFSVTADVHSDFTKSFVEHGFVFGLCVARYDHTYQQGLERFWSRTDRFDYYWPSLAYIGEQPVKRKEIYCTGIPDNDDRVFGYQEAWADYRYKPSRVAGEMRSRVPNTLDVWHLADNYSGSPFLSAEWIEEDKTNLNRALAVSDSVSNQLWADIFVKNISVRPMPIYSIPGLIDHY